MRSLRDPLNRRPAAIFTVLLVCGFPACRRDSPPSPAAASEQPSYYPLAVGNSWTYRCSVEGTFQFEKTIEIVSEEVRNGTRFWRTKLSVSAKKASPFYYLFASADGTVFKSAMPDQETVEPVVNAQMKVGDRLGQFVAAGLEKADTPATNLVEALRLENFARDDPAVSAEKRTEWLGRFYVRGIGPVIEADGAGGECVLARYHVSGQ